MLDEAELDEAETSELVDDFLERAEINSFKSITCVRDFEELAGAIDPDYRGVYDFLEDNPGAIEAMVKWIRDAKLAYWQENLRKAIRVKMGPQ